MADNAGRDHAAGEQIFIDYDGGVGLRLAWEMVHTYGYPACIAAVRVVSLATLAVEVLCQTTCLPMLAGTAVNPANRNRPCL